MFITSVGIYGFLVSAYQETAYKVQEVEKKVKVENTKLKRYQEQLVNITTEKTSFDISKGDYVIFSKGLKCYWEVFIPIKKYYNFK